MTTSAVPFFRQDVARLRVTRGLSPLGVGRHGGVADLLEVQEHVRHLAVGAAHHKRYFRASPGLLLSSSENVLKEGKNVFGSVQMSTTAQTCWSARARRA